jgi:hypothetical protein
LHNGGKCAVDYTHCAWVPWRAVLGRIRRWCQGELGRDQQKTVGGQWRRGKETVGGNGDIEVTTGGSCGGGGKEEKDGVCCVPSYSHGGELTRKPLTSENAGDKRAKHQKKRGRAYNGPIPVDRW